MEAGVDSSLSSQECHQVHGESKEGKGIFVSKDGGQKKYVLSCTLTDKSDPNDVNDDYKSTGTMKNLILLQADINSECYENLVILSKLVKLDIGRVS